MSEHTKEPLSSVWDEDEAEFEIRDAEGQLTFETWASYPEVRKADARRLCAVWNACAGLSTEALESGALADLIAVVRSYSPGHHTAPLAKLEGK